MTNIIRILLNAVAVLAITAAFGRAVSAVVSVGSLFDARRSYRRGYYGHGYSYGYRRPYYGYGHRRPYYGYGYGRRWRY